MVRAVIAVLLRDASEFRHRHQNDVFHAVAHILAKGRQSGAELTQQLRQLLLLILMMIPPADFREWGNPSRTLG
jgi:hypothetical protein